MPKQEIVEFVIDTKQVQSGVDSANKSIVTFEQTGTRANQTVQSSFDKTGETVSRTTDRMNGLSASMQRQLDQALAHQSAMQRYSSEMERWAVTTARSIGNIGHAAAHGVEGVLALGGALAGTKYLLREATEEASLFEVGLGKVRNAGRAIETAFAGLRGGLTAAVDTAGVLAAAAAVEKIAEVTYERGKQLEQQSVQAAKSGLGYDATATLGFAASRAGVAPDFFDQAAKRAGGVAQLGDEFKRLGEIADPVARADAAFKSFGEDAEKFLPLLNNRLGENIQRFSEWGLALDRADREHITQFKRDVDSLKESFVGLGDTIATWSTNVGNYFARVGGSIYSTLRGIPDFARQSTALLATALSVLPGVPTGIAFGEQKFDAAGALKEHQAQFGVGPASEAALVQALQKLAPTGTQLFLGGRGDQESALQSRVGDLQKQLFVSDPTAKNFGQLQPAASFPGGYTGQALALQQYVSGKQRIDQLDAEKKALAEMESAEKAVAAALQSAQLAELSGADRLRAEREIAIKQYGVTKDLIGQINKEFDIRFQIEGKHLTDQSHADLVSRAEAEARSQEGLANARAQITASALLQTSGLNEAAAGKRGALDLQQAGLERDQQLLALSGQSQGLLPEPGLRSARDLSEVTLRQKLSVESQKFEIEKTYLEKSRTLELSGVDEIYRKQLNEAQVDLNGKLISEKAFQDRRAALEQNAALDRKALNLSVDGQIDDARLHGAIESNKLIAEDNQKTAQLMQKQFESITAPLEHLFDTLFTRPQDFGKQLASTLQRAALQPITQGLASVTARAVYPAIYGNNGAGGIAGSFQHIFGGGVNLAAPVNQLVSSPGGGNLPTGNAYSDQSPSSGGSIPAGSGGFTGGFPLSALTGLLPALTLSQALPSGINPAASIGPGGTASFSPSPIGFGGTYSGGTPAYSGGGGTSSTGGGVFGGLRGLFGGNSQGKSGGGFGGLFSNPGSLVGYKGGGEWNTTSQLGAAQGDFSEASGFSGAVQGIAGSPAGGAAGLFLAQQGLLGNSRGTGLGIAEGTVGGALIGEQIGGPWGAAIGAAAGFGIGLGELVAGVEPQWREAQRLVKSKFNINIPHSEGQKIADIANSSFGGKVSVAVESPQVRQLLGLYAAGTGQKFPASADLPHAGSLLQQGGTLYQQQTFQYGQGYALSSNLPIAGGYSPQSLPSPTYGNVTLSVNGQSAADLLEGRVASVATPGYIQSAYSASLASSDGRVDNAIDLSEPGLIAS